MNIKLVIGNKNYSTWSLRPWLLLTAFDIHFEEIHESLHPDALRDRLLAHSPAGKVPVLIEPDVLVWDSLAICEYVSDVHLDGKGWPHTAKNRAKARAICCEMHSGFNALREALPMNIRAKRRVALSAALKIDIARIDTIWSEHHRAGWLFERFGIADCFYAPVALRFETYNIDLSPAARAYQLKLLAHPALQLWIEAARAETEVVAADEAGVEV
ncbi:glutathione S-transferase family protein [Reinekea sp.]|jgi:glutathione S-transferase|uniref:glutathione S-transferase family protein n=1 Tax=Reinekea sp. TaxID=1970455 RepID=UPI002A8163A8|nr:glutathione S-transferase family protein [Reinekea sp.]